MKGAAPSLQELEAGLDEFRISFGRLKDEVQKVIVGHDVLLKDMLVAIFSRGHVLLEGVPGLGKTTLVKVLGTVLGLEPGRIQCTPDLMPADILGTQVVSEDEHGHRSFHFVKGPVFANVVLVDEVNRATPKTQSALLEVMQEHTVTSGGERHLLPEPFFVIATQNPLEMEGTYPLPEAQLDRFLFKLRVPFPSQADLVEITRRTTAFETPEARQVIAAGDLLRFQKLLTEVAVSNAHLHYAATLVLGTHPESARDEKIRRYVAYGSSPRGMQALIRGARVHAVLDGRTSVGEDDLKEVAHESLRHRIILNFEGDAESLDVDELIDDLLRRTPDLAGKMA
jgi:MoxR-like ATPase